MEFSKLEYIVKVAELGNITRASEELFMTQPALSHFLSRIEKEEGVRLFDRSSNPITMTYEGEKYVETAKKILELNRSLEEEIAAVTSSRKGRLRIGIPPLRAAGMLPRILPAFADRYPQVEIQTVEHNSRQLREDVLRGSVDFAILPRLGNLRDFECTELCREELFLTARKGFLQNDTFTVTAEGERVVDFTALRDVPFILLKSGHGARGALDTLFDLHGYKPRIFMETTNNETAFGLAAAGLGVAVVPRITIDTIRHENPVEVFRLSETGYYWDIVAISRINEHLNLLEKEFIQLIMEVFAK